MIVLVLAVLALFVVQTILPSRFRERVAAGEDRDLKRRLHNRDLILPLTLTGERAARALLNLQEALPVFLALALMNMIVGTSASLAITGALVFLIARVLYLAAYLAGLGPLRSLLWGVSWIGLGMMVAPLLDRI